MFSRSWTRSFFVCFASPLSLSRLSPTLYVLLLYFLFTPQGADSAFTSHKPFLGELIAALNARSLKSAEYPFADGDAKRQ